MNIKEIKEMAKAILAGIVIVYSMILIMGIVCVAEGHWDNPAVGVLDITLRAIGVKK